jgi:hypothetical protein
MNSCHCKNANSSLYPAFKLVSHRLFIHAISLPQVVSSPVIQVKYNPGSDKNNPTSPPPSLGIKYTVLLLIFT